MFEIKRYDNWKEMLKVTSEDKIVFVRISQLTDRFFLESPEEVDGFCKALKQASKKAFKQ